MKNPQLIRVFAGHPKAIGQTHSVSQEEKEFESLLSLVEVFDLSKTLVIEIHSGIGMLFHVCMYQKGQCFQKPEQREPTRDSIKPWLSTVDVGMYEWLN